MNEENAADALQDTILTCWEKLYTLKKPEFFKTWMTKVLINHCYDIIIDVDEVAALIVLTSDGNEKVEIAILK